MAKKLLFGLLAATLLLVGCETAEAPGGNQPPVDEVADVDPVGHYAGSYTWDGEKFVAGVEVVKGALGYKGLFLDEEAESAIGMECSVEKDVIACTVDLGGLLAKFDGALTGSVWRGKVSKGSLVHDWEPVGDFLFNKLEEL